MNPSRHPSCRARFGARNRSAVAAFTLTEMLVVAAIIALLMSFLVPSLDKAQLRALKAACTNNLRQIGVAATAYEADNEGYMLYRVDYTNDPVHGDWKGHWSNTLPPYFGRDNFAAVEKSVATCPVQFEFQPQNYTYGINRWICADTDNGLNGGCGCQPGPIKKVRFLRGAPDCPDRWPNTAATVPYFVDGSVNDSSRAYIFQRRQEDNAGSAIEVKKQSWPHDLTANILFIDGHVEALPYTHTLFTGSPLKRPWFRTSGGIDWGASNPCSGSSELAW